MHRFLTYTTRITLQSGLDQISYWSFVGAKWIHHGNDHDVSMSRVANVLI